MKAKISVFLLVVVPLLLSAGSVEKTFHFSNYTIAAAGEYQTVNFGNTMLTGVPGEPLLPWHQVMLMLPPGEAAVSIEITGMGETVIPGQFLIAPKQHIRTINEGNSGNIIRNDKIYRQNRIYAPPSPAQLLTQYLDGYAFALSAFSPVKYNPAKRQLSYFTRVTVRIVTRPDDRSHEAMKHLSASENIARLVGSAAQNPEMMSFYPVRKSPATSYQYLIISPAAFRNEFGALTSMYAVKGIISKIVTVDSLTTYGTGYDAAEKIRNYIIAEHQQSGIQYVLLAGNPPLVPARGLFCQVWSGGGYYTDYNIPADLYFSGLDGNFDLNGNHIYGEPADAADLLPDVSVGRFTVNDTAELHHMIHKTVSYLTNPVLGEMKKPLLAGEWLYGGPLTYGSTYMNLLIGNHGDNGYYTHGIPPATNNIEKLYDSLSWTWSPSQLLVSFNSGKSFIHHLGHANETYSMRLSMSQITNVNFPAVDGITHNYEIVYTQGCDDGAWDWSGGCIGARAVAINNFLVAGIFNSRYGWFDEGTSEGPSEHLEREFVSAMYRDTLPDRHIGNAHMISKIKTAPWIGLPLEFEPGAQRWCQFDCNLFGDPALEVWTDEPTVFSTATWTGAVDSNWNNPANWSTGIVPTTLYDLTFPSNKPHYPVINTINLTFCHNLNVQSGATLTINPGKSMVVYGSVTLIP